MKMFEEKQIMTAYILIYENLGHIPDSYKFIGLLFGFHLLLIQTYSDYVGALWCNGLCSRLVIRRSWVRIPLGAYAFRQGTFELKPKIPCTVKGHTIPLCPEDDINVYGRVQLP